MGTTSNTVTPETMQHASALLSRWLRQHRELFPQTDAIDVVVPWLTFRIASTFERGGVQVDLGGGLNIANGFLAELGMTVWVIDLLEEYFPQSSMKTEGTEQVAFLESKGVQFIRADLVEFNLLDHFNPGSVDVVSSYHTLEHLHHSPRRMLASAMKILKPGGRVFFEVPNATNLLKRLKVLIGRTNYQPFQGFWEVDKYYGHIREYCVDDLRQLARHLHLTDVRIVGRNWYGSLYAVIPTRSAAGVVDSILQLRPGLCGSLFLSGRKSPSSLLVALRD
jgi:SAM-dependent methyltransferase